VTAFLDLVILAGAFKEGLDHGAVELRRDRSDSHRCHPQAFVLGLMLRAKSI
jgi:hypothetical protein